MVNLEYVIRVDFEIMVSEEKMSFDAIEKWFKSAECVAAYENEWTLDEICAAFDKCRADLVKYFQERVK